LLWTLKLFSEEAGEGSIAGNMETNLKDWTQICSSTYVQTEDDCCLSWELTLLHDKSAPARAVATDHMRNVCASTGFHQRTMTRYTQFPIK